MKREIRIGVAMAVLAAALGAGWSARAADTPGMEGAQLLNPESDPSQLLGDVYKLDEDAVSVEICPPADSRIINRRGGVDLMSFIVDNKSWGGSLQLVTIANNAVGDMGQLKGSMTLPGYIKASMDEINKSFKAVEKIDDSKLEFQKHPASMLTVKMVAELGTGLPGGAKNSHLHNQSELVPLLRQQLIVQMKENQFMVLTFYTPLKDQEEANKTFKAMLQSFLIKNPIEQKQKLAESVLLGKTWMQGISAEQLLAKINKQPQMYRMASNGTDIGYARFDEHETTNLGLKGIEMMMNSRRFMDDGQIVYGKNVAFWAYSQDEKGVKIPHYSMWDNVAKRAVPVAATRTTPATMQEFWTDETGALNLEADPHFTEQDIKEMQTQWQKQKDQDPAHPPPPILASATRYHLCVNLGGDPTQNRGRANLGFDERLPPNTPTPLPKILEYTWPRMVDLKVPHEMAFVVYDSDPSLKVPLTLRTLTVTGKQEKVMVGGKPVECWKCIDQLGSGSTTIWVDTVGNIVSMRTSDRTTLTPTTEPDMQRRWGIRDLMADPIRRQ